MRKVLISLTNPDSCNSDETYDEQLKCDIPAISKNCEGFFALWIFDVII